MFYFKGELHDAITDKVHYPSISSHRFADISSEVLGISSFGKKLSQSKFTKPVGDDFLLILPSVIVNEIVTLLYPAFDIEKIESGESFLAGKQGERIGSDKVHLLDNALLPSGYNSRSFDSNGYPPRVLTLINEGLFQDCYVPHRSKAGFPTGHLGFDGELWAGNLLVHNGRRSQNMVLADRSMALLATETLEAIQLDIKTGRIRILANYQVVSSNGLEGELGTKEINCHVTDLLKLVMETTNDQKRTTFIDSSSWVLENCSLFIS
jgi:PmbA protein